MHFESAIYRNFNQKKWCLCFFFDLKKMNFTATVQCFSIFPNHWNHQKSPEFSKIQKKIGESSPLFFLFSRYKKSRILATLCCHNFWIKILWQHKNLICKVVATQKNFLSITFLWQHKISISIFVLPQNCKLEICVATKLQIWIFWIMYQCDHCKWLTDVYFQHVFGCNFWMCEIAQHHFPWRELSQHFD